MTLGVAGLVGPVPAAVASKINLSLSEFIINSKYCPELKNWQTDITQINLLRLRRATEYSNFNIFTMEIFNSKKYTMESSNFNINEEK